MDPSIDQSLIGGGFTFFNGPYISLNRDEQPYFANAGITVVAAAISAAYVPAAPFAAGIASVLTTYVSQHGVCPGNLRIYFPSFAAECE